ncbi:MAG TPA: thiamine phosphate synthase, partial [Polyangia bacterium]
DEAAAAARNPNVVFAVYGPVYSTPEKGEPVGLTGPRGLSAAVVAGGALPVLALGGVGPAQVPECLASGAAGVACIRAVISAAKPDQIVGRIMICHEI